MTASASERTRTVRVAPIPAHHPYVDAVAPLEQWPEARRAVPAEVADLPEGGWAPHPLLEAERLEQAGPELEALHVHFGCEHRSPEQIRELTAACRRADVRLVVTVHDLRNPHVEDQSEHRERTGELVRAADEVLTLTDGAAREIADRWGRQARVVPHPQVVAPERARAIRETVRRPGGRVGVFLKDLRRSTTTSPRYFRELAQALAPAGAAGAPAARLRVFLDERRADAPVARALERIEGLELVLHPRMDDDRLHAEIAACDVVVLPYLSGTHSGWLEMCRDLGVTVVAPDCGHYAQQADQPGAVLEHPTGDGRAAGLAAGRALARGPLPLAVDRTSQLEGIRRVHREVLTGASGAVEGPIA